MNNYDETMGHEPVEMAEGTPDDKASSGSTICINCYPDGTYDVYPGPFTPATEADYPGGLFGLETIDDALKAVIALKREGKDYHAAEEEAIRGAYGGEEKSGIPG